MPTRLDTAKRQAEQRRYALHRLETEPQRERSAALQSSRRHHLSVELVQLLEDHDLPVWPVRFLAEWAHLGGPAAPHPTIAQRLAYAREIIRRPLPLDQELPEWHF